MSSIDGSINTSKRKLSKAKVKSQATNDKDVATQSNSTSVFPISPDSHITGVRTSNINNATKPGFLRNTVSSASKSKVVSRSSSPSPTLSPSVSRHITTSPHSVSKSQLKTSTKSPVVSSHQRSTKTATVQPKPPQVKPLKVSPSLSPKLHSPSTQRKKSSLSHKNYIPHSPKTPKREHKWTATNSDSPPLSNSKSHTTTSKPKKAKQSQKSKHLKRSGSVHGVLVATPATPITDAESAADALLQLQQFLAVIEDPVIEEALKLEEVCDQAYDTNIISG